MDFGGLHYTAGESNASMHFTAIGLVVAVLSVVAATRVSKRLGKPLLILAAGGALVGVVGGFWMAGSHVYRTARLLTGDTSMLQATVPVNKLNSFVINPLGVPVRATMG